jgi:acyl dehydratase
MTALSITKPETIMATNVFFEDVNIGDELPEFIRKTDFMNWNRFAAVNDEFVYLHMDDEIGKAAGQGAAFGMGNLRYSYVLNALRQWIGDEAEIRELTMQFRAINHKNDELSTHCRVVDKEIAEGEHRIHLDIDVRNQNDESTSPGKAIVVLPSRSA